MTEEEFLELAEEAEDGTRRDPSSGKFKPGQSGNMKGRPKGAAKSHTINDEDREFYGTDSRLFLERALARATTFEEGLKYAKELRMLQHPSLQSVQTQVDNYHTITLTWDFGSATNQVEHKPTREKVLEHVGKAIIQKEANENDG